MALANVIRVSLQGTMPNGEVWSINPVYQIGGVNTSEDISSTQCLAMATAIDALTIPTGLRAVNTNTVFWSGCRVEARKWNGDLVSQADHARATPVNGTVTNVAHPFQTSIVTSLRTTGTGARGRGRLYLPATGMTLDNTLRPNATLVGQTLTGMRQWLTAVGGAIGATTVNAPVLSVWSRVSASTLPVNSIQMGDVPDTQRRRRDSLIESYTALSYPT